MIGFLQGTVLLTKETELLLNVSGVGYRVYAPLVTISTLVIGEDVSFFVHTHVREDHIALYGFKTESELFCFEKLTSVSGIGPKSALAMLSVHSPASLAQAIEHADSETISHTPGVGKKTAEKIILELKGKLSHLLEDTQTESAFEVKLALEALGYSSKEIHQALKSLTTEGKTTGTIIKEALQQLQ